MLPKPKDPVAALISTLSVLVSGGIRSCTGAGRNLERAEASLSSKSGHLQHSLKKVLSQLAHLVLIDPGWDAWLMVTKFI